MNDDKVNDDKVGELISKYFRETNAMRAQFHARMLGVFTEITGASAAELCLVEERRQEGIISKTIFYFDWKKEVKNET